MAKPTKMRAGSTGPDPNALAAGRFASDREGKVLEVILNGATEGTVEAILAYLQAHPPAGYRGKIRRETVHYFTKSAVEAGIIEARRMGGRTVYIPLEDGPPFARATAGGLAFRERVLSGSAPVAARGEARPAGGMVAERRARVKELMARLQEQGLGLVSSTERRDRFSLARGLPAASRLTDLPYSSSFIRSENGSLLFRAPADELRAQLTTILPSADRGEDPRRLEYRWLDLNPEVLDQMFAAVSEIGRSLGLAAAASRGLGVLVARLDCEEIPATDRNWMMNDANDRHVHSAVRLTESPLSLRLLWKARPGGAEVTLGCFRLHLLRLLEHDYVRHERAADAAQIRLRFVRGDDGVVSIQYNDDAPSLPVAWVEPADLSSAGH